MDKPRTVWAGDNFIVNHNGEEMLLRIVSDEDPQNPREWDNVGTMVCWHRRYNLGDKHNYPDPNDFLLSLALGKSLDEIDDARNEAYGNGENYQPDDLTNSQLLELASKNNVILPLYLYDHSGITINTTGHTCQWDSGQVGWIYVSKDKMFAEFKAVNEENWREIAELSLKSEVQMYDDYITGSVLGYEIHQIQDGEVENMPVDSCYGFFGHDTERNGILEQFTMVRPANVKVTKVTTTTLTIE